MTTIAPSAPAPSSAASSAVSRATAFLDALFPVPRPFHVRLWEGTVLPAHGTAEITLVLRTPGALRRMFRLPLEARLGEAYLRGDFDLEGELWKVGPALEAARRAATSPAELLRLARLWRALPRDGAARAGPAAARMGAREWTREWDREGIRYHYDAGNDFYALFLDRRMVYSCAYFATPRDDIHTAQERKLEHICRKLRLRAGERLLDVGCGWGGLVMYAAERYGVHAVGVTLSQAQAELARERVRRAGLQDRVRIELGDYRDLDAQSFDKAASVGMFEHVGPARLPEYFAHVHRLLKPGGLFLNHGIGNRPVRPASPARRAARRAVRRWVLGTGHYTRSYVFPSGGAVPVSHANLVAEAAGWEVRDVENLREHYGHTLRNWARRLEEHRDDAMRLDARTYRIWRLYLGVASWQFTSGELAVYQTLLEKPPQDGTALPLTRADIYA
ncbi:MAG TPA: cyclopropane-fatty-acyl-phospholipid synthase family protein [Longimicrobium sp.]|nr:cyclopropane-fatty-acyl-phospholipid synthase family protein [Longimicrobium sp.]